MVITYVNDAEQLKKATVHEDKKEGIYYSKDFVFRAEVAGELTTWEVVRPLTDEERRKYYPNYYRGSKDQGGRDRRDVTFRMDMMQWRALDAAGVNKSLFIREAVREALLKLKK